MILPVLQTDIFKLENGIHYLYIVAQKMQEKS